LRRKNIFLYLTSKKHQQNNTANTLQEKNIYKIDGYYVDNIYQLSILFIKTHHSTPK